MATIIIIIHDAAVVIRQLSQSLLSDVITFMSFFPGTYQHINKCLIFRNLVFEFLVFSH
jgi:hypothetical protein